MRLLKRILPWLVIVIGLGALAILMLPIMFEHLLNLIVKGQP